MHIYPSLSLPYLATWVPNPKQPSLQSGTTTIAPFVQAMQQLTVQALLERCTAARAVSPRERCGRTKKNNIVHGKSMGHRS